MLTAILTIVLGWISKKLAAFSKRVFAFAWPFLLSRQKRRLASAAARTAAFKVAIILYKSGYLRSDKWKRRMASFVTNSGRKIESWSKEYAP